MKELLTSYLMLILLFSSLTIFSQGSIDHIKNQEYLKFKDKLDCNNQQGDNLSEKICTNLAFQKSDSLLTQVYDSLIIEAKKLNLDSIEIKIINLQKNWRKFRDEHCAIVYDTYKNCGACHQRSIDYLNCLRELTEHRIMELKRLLVK